MKHPVTELEAINDALDAARLALLPQKESIKPCWIDETLRFEVEIAKLACLRLIACALTDIRDRR